MQKDASAARVVLSTAPDADTAARIARGLVEAGLAACVNIVGAVTSIYTWKGAVQEDQEVLLVIKTTAARLAELESALVRLHPYEVPELVAIAPAHVEPRYLAWLLGASAPIDPPA